MTVVGSGDFRYEVVEGLGAAPAGWQHKDVAGVATDSKDRVYLITAQRSARDRLRPRRHVRRARGARASSPPRTHGITVGPDDSVCCVDDGGHVVKKYTPDGELLLTLGTGRAVRHRLRRQHRAARITHGGPPFNRPTNLAVGAERRPLRLGRLRQLPGPPLLGEWQADPVVGRAGHGAGQFNLPHGIGVPPDGRVLVADRENDRIQVFSPTGEYIAEWLDVQRPTQIFSRGDGIVYVSELQWMPGQVSFRRCGKAAQRKPARVSVLRRERQAARAGWRRRRSVLLRGVSARRTAWPWTARAPSTSAR